jgi:hypothetical protein
MAKEDFCFTYYDGDAARDTTHMNRLERGAYHDIIISQRKFGRLTLDQVKKILGKDFTECWPALELIMKVADGKVFIEWVENSIIKMRKHAKKQSENKKGKTKNNQTETKQEPKPIQTKPLEDGDGNEDVIEINDKESQNDFTNPDVEGDEIIFPIDTIPARELWANWKKYRWSQHGAKYGMMGEQSDLKRLEKMDYAQMEETILTAIAGNWKNLYPDKIKPNGNGNFKDKRQTNIDTLATNFAKEYGTGHKPS